jgi:hypothetical protein
MIPFSSDYFLRCGNLLLLMAYSVRDILWLRLFAVAAALITIPFFVLQPTVLRAERLELCLRIDQRISILVAFHRTASGSIHAI